MLHQRFQHERISIIIMNHRRTYFRAGPIEFDIENYMGGLPKLRDYKYAWTKVAY